MNRFSVIFFLLLCICYSSLYTNHSFAQGTAINASGNPPDPSAGLDISFNNKGLLIPRMSDTERNAIINPANGLIIFNTTTGCLNYYNTGNWYQWCGTCIPPSAPAVSGNSPICAGDSLKLFAATIPNVTYNWTGPNGFTSSLQNPIIPNAGTANAGVYNCTSGINGCYSSVSSTTAVINTIPVSQFTWSPLPAVFNSDVTFSPTTTGASYAWTFQNGTPLTSTAQNPLVQWANTGSYNVVLVVSNNGCSSTTTNSVAITSCTHGTQTFSYTGNMQSFTVPGICGTTIDIEVWGARGGNASNQNAAGGLGARMKGTFTVTSGQLLNILVGQSGADASCTAGGGGGTFVVSNNVLLIAAGGGGGGGTYNNTPSSVKDGTANNNGNTGYNGNTLTQNAGGGGSGGNGGGCVTGSGGGGAGYSGNGSTCNAQGGNSYINGGAGGAVGSLGGNTAGAGGYGGGGGSECYWDGAGGGGGYSGGGGGYYYGAGGGGGSYNSGTNQSNASGVQSGNGQVTITW
ncbi:MAG: PKD domain-containing protein [Bacteroidota bacterium]